MEIVMALFDFIPVGLYFAAMIILQICLYNHMSKYQFALFASGSIMVLTAGILKVLYKLFYYGVDIDIYRFNYLFFPIQAIGFVLVFLGLLFMIVIKKKGAKLNSLLFLSTLIPDEGKTLANDTMLYVILQILGSGGIYVCIGYLAKKMKKPLVMVLMAVAFILMLAMGFLSTRISRSTGDEYIMYNWLAEIVNTFGQGSLLAGAIILKKSGLKDIELK